MARVDVAGKAVRRAASGRNRAASRGGAPVFGLAVKTAARRRASRLACVIDERTHANLCRGAPVCAPVHESSMYAAGRHIGRPLQGLQTYFVFWRGCACRVRAAGGACPAPTTEWFCILTGLRLFRSCSGRGKPRPYKGTRLFPHTRKERHMALRLVD